MVLSDAVSDSKPINITGTAQTELKDHETLSMRLLVSEDMFPQKRIVPPNFKTVNTLLTVFALLGLSTVQAGGRLSRTMADSVEAYYEADCMAEEIYARLRSGEAVESVEQIDGQHTYSVTVSEHQTLRVTLENRNGSWEVISWQTLAHMEERDNTLPVWQGQEG